ncbi:hypothetical protein HY969_00700 [Candidatus Kaiserbacteria bacterium]|nr:hypothetical protein [Candidatus Kaiserbacteria bacterium]
MSTQAAKTGEGLQPSAKENLETESLSMRFLRRNDGPRIFSHYDQQLFERWAVEEQTMSEVESGIGNSRDMIAKGKTWLDLAITPKNQSNIVGRCGIFRNREKDNGEYRIDLWFDAPGNEVKYAVETIQRIRLWAREYRKEHPNTIKYLALPITEGSIGEKVLSRIGKTSDSSMLGVEIVGEGENEKEVKMRYISL